MNWDLDKLYQGLSDPTLARDLERAIAHIDAAKALLSSPPQNPRDMLTGMIAEMKAAYEPIARAGSMVFLTLAVDAENEAARALYDRLMDVYNRVGPIMSGLAAYLGKLDGLEPVIASDPALTEHAYLLQKLRQKAAHTIDPALEETVLKLQLTGGRAFSQLRDLLDATHLMDIESDGEVQKLPLSAVRGMAYSPDPKVRRAAYEAEIAAYPRIEIPMAAALGAIKGEAITLSELKRYDSVLSWMLDESHMDRETLDALLTAMRESLPAFRRYFKAKARALGHAGGLPFYDLFAPLGRADARYTLDQAKDVLIEVLSQFSAKMADFIRRAFDERWIDAYPRAGKQGGAFCSEVHPLGISYVMTNFEGSFSSVSTLAHELGHAYHNDCVKHNSILNSDYPMPLAETASIFNETLLTQKMMERAGGAELIMLLDQEISDAAQVIVDILSRYLFETRVFEIRAERTPSARELKEIMLDAQRETYGDGLDEHFLHPYMWACKGHYYSPERHFYNFPYAFGLLFGKGVFAQYQSQGESFVPEYDRLLNATATGDIYDVAAGVGIDVHSVDFWRSSLKVVEESIDRLIGQLEVEERL